MVQQISIALQEPGNKNWSKNIANELLHYYNIGW